MDFDIFDQMLYLQNDVRKVKSNDQELIQSDPISALKTKR